MDGIEVYYTELNQNIISRMIQMRTDWSEHPVTLIDSDAVQGQTAYAMNEINELYGQLDIEMQNMLENAIKFLQNIAGGFETADTAMAGVFHVTVSEQERQQARILKQTEEAIKDRQDIQYEGLDD